MNASINHRELTFKAIAGLAGGALGWLPVELASHGRNLTDVMSTWDIFSAYATMAILSGMIGGMILASDEQKLALTPVVRSRFVLGFAVCALLMMPGNYYANIVFSRILNDNGFPNMPFSALVFGRAVSWLMMGTMLGAGVGLAGFLGSIVPQIRRLAGSVNFPVINIAKGAAGGFIGGFAGGLIFDPVGYMTGGGLSSRLVGLSLIGLAIGLLIGLVQELTKSAWLTVEAGRLKGRQYRLEGAISSIGRAEENPVGLFGDSAVQARHAAIEHRGNDYTLRGLAIADGTFVNGERIESATLHDGDRIRIGGYELSFHLRGVRSGAAAPPASVTSPRTFAPAPAASTNGAVLVDATGKSFPIQTGKETTIGRSLDNDIVLADASVSRHHASIAAAGGGYRMRDLGSQNGTFVRGERINDASLSNGDPVRVGDAAFTFRA
ncbi:MAG TPA: FHA domain-containing protein [Candidatus Binataceae bacterium]|nr:FHA domain-containing protein [Candidatus Binataceae bacterium]